MISRENFNKKQILYCFTSLGEKLSYKNENVVIKDKDNKVILQTTCYRLFAIFIIGDITITSQVIKHSNKFGYSIIFMNSNFKIYDSIGFKLKGNTILNAKQYAYNSNELARYFVVNKVENEIALLKQIRGKDESKSETIRTIDRYLNELKCNEISELTINKIMGYEGVCAKNYFDCYFKDIEWQGRQPRIKKDYINSILDIGYTFLFNYIDILLLIYGFDIYKGFLHQQFYMRKSLVCDFVEPFRVIIDKQVKKSINLKQFTKDDFEVIKNRYLLKYSENKKYTKIFSGCIDQYKDQIFVFVQSFYRNFMKNIQVDKYDKFILE